MRANNFLWDPIQLDSGNRGYVLRRTRYQQVNAVIALNPGTLGLGHNWTVFVAGEEVGTVDRWEDAEQLAYTTLLLKEAANANN